MENKIRVGVVGLGRAGWNIHIKGLREREEFEIVEVADPDKTRQKEAADELGCATFDNLTELLKDGRSDLVVVATPNTLHESDAVAVLEAGKDCVLEKPMAMSHAGAAHVLETARARERKLFVHHQHLFGDEFNFLREIRDSGLIGDLFELRINWCGFSRRNDWQTLKKNGGGHLNNHGPHALTIALGLLDSPVQSVSADVRHIKDAGDAEDHSHLFIKTESGRVADVFLSTCCAMPLPRTVMLGGTGTVVLDSPEEARLRFYDGTKVPPLEVVDGASRERKYGNDDVLPWQEETRAVKPAETPGSFYDNVAAVLRDNAKMVVTPESALEVTRVIEWAYNGKDPAA